MFNVLSLGWAKFRVHRRATTQQRANIARRKLARMSYVSSTMGDEPEPQYVPPTEGALRFLGQKKPGRPPVEEANHGQPAPGAFGASMFMAVIEAATRKAQNIPSEPIQVHHGNAVCFTPSSTLHLHLLLVLSFEPYPTLWCATLCGRSACQLQPLLRPSRRQSRDSKLWASRQALASRSPCPARHHAVPLSVLNRPRKSLLDHNSGAIGHQFHRGWPQRTCHRPQTWFGTICPRPHRGCTCQPSPLQPSNNRRWISRWRNHHTTAATVPLPARGESSLASK